MTSRRPRQPTRLRRRFHPPLPTAPTSAEVPALAGPIFPRAPSLPRPTQLPPSLIPPVMPTDPANIPSPDPVPPPRRGGWTLGALTLGLSIVAACVLLPQIHENRNLRSELAALQSQVDRIKQQVEINDAFLAKVDSDPTLITRLAQRQFLLTPDGTDVLTLPNSTPNSADPRQPAPNARNPFQLVAVPDRPADPTPTSLTTPTPHPVLDFIAAQLSRPFQDPQTRLYLLAGSMFLVAVGLILDGPAKPPRPTPAPATHPNTPEPLSPESVTPEPAASADPTSTHDNAHAAAPSTPSGPATHAALAA